MKKVYLKNYKGFNSEIIELRDVNFLVGENSTGKTSFLKAINLLSSKEEFNNIENQLGYFDEILSKNSRDKFFQLGFEKESEKFDSKIKEKFRILFNFVESNSNSEVSYLKVTIANFDVLIKFDGDSFDYNMKPQTNNNFKEWVNDINFTGKIVKRPYFRVSSNYSLVINIIEFELKSELKDYQISYAGINFYDNYKWLAPIRAKAQRIYESYNVNFSPEGNHIPILLKKIFSSANKNQKFNSTLKKFGTDSNLFDEIEIKKFGNNGSSPFEIIVKYKNVEVKLPNTGYGVSQVLPIVIEILSNKGTTFSIQQPEVHLHPKAQSAFGSFLFTSAQNDNNVFIIETHSDFTINKFRYNLSTSKKTKFKSQVLFFERNSIENKIVSINIKGNGEYENDLPDSYKDFFIDEELKLLEI